MAKDRPAQPKKKPGRPPWLPEGQQMVRWTFRVTPAQLAKLKATKGAGAALREAIDSWR